MKLRRFKVSRLEQVIDLFYDLIPTIWVHDPESKPDWYQKVDFQEWLHNIQWSVTALIKGYYEAYTLEDEHFLTQEQVFPEKKVSDWEYFGKKDVYPPRKGEGCLDGGKCEWKVVEWGIACRHGDCTWYCPLKIQREEEKRRFEEMRDWMENRK
jgi:hypothetical protein